MARADHRVSREDFGFRQRFEACEVPAAEFDHRAHLRLAYGYLCELDEAAATARMRAALLAFLKHLGVGAGKYHETMTRAWIAAVGHFMRQGRGSTSAAAFMAQHPALLDARVMLTHYSAERLFSDEARQRFLPPDLQAIPPPL